MPSSKSPHTASKVQRWSRLLTQFLVGQACIQFLNLITGFYLLRWMSVEEYAQISLVLAFQATLSALVDLGFSGCIVALVGERGNDAECVGQYVYAAKKLRSRFVAVALLIAAVIFPVFNMRHGWPITTVAILFGSIAASIIFQTWQVYAAPLLISGRLNSYYRPQMIGSVARLACCLVLHQVGVLNAGFVSWISAIVIAYTGLYYKRNTSDLLVEPTHDNSERRNEIIRYLMPLMPGIIFTAFQGQITVCIVALSGKTSNIAEVAALGRLGQIFLILGALNGAIIEPLIARTAARQLFRRYILVVASAIGCVMLICLFSFSFPQILLWLLGPNYRNVGNAVGWSVVASSVSYVATVLWTMNSARKWVFWWYTGLNIVLICAAQIGTVMTTDLSKTINVMYFAVATGAGSLLAHIICAIYGLWTTNRPGHDSTKGVNLSASKEGPANAF